MLDWLGRIGKLWPYITFYFRNREKIDALIDDALSIAAKFQRENPAVPEEWKPKSDDVIGAIADNAKGKTQVLTPKPVQEWTMREWETYWRIGNGSTI